MAPDPDSPKLKGIVELDEVYVGPRKPRYKGVSGPGRSTLKTPVFCAVERGGQLRRRVVADVTASTLRDAIRFEVDSRAKLMTDEYPAYRWLKRAGQVVTNQSATRLLNMLHLVALGERNRVVLRKKFSRSQLLAYQQVAAGRLGLEIEECLSLGIQYPDES